MAVDSLHPAYVEMSPDWELMRVCDKGSRAVKEAGELYLPATASMRLGGMKAGDRGRMAYDRYRARAVVPSLVPDAIDSMLGAMHFKPPTITLPQRLEPLLSRSTIDNETLAQLLMRVNRLQLRDGRCGLLGEVPSGVPGAEAVPYIAVYEAASIINWDVGARDELTTKSLNLVVLNESEFERDEDFEWDHVEKYRVLVLGDLSANESAGAVYQWAVVREETQFDPARLAVAEIAGVPASEIPFVFVNTCDIVPAPDRPPLIGVAERQISIYQLDADHRFSLHMTGQDTLVVRGLEVSENKTPMDAVRVGADAVIRVAENGEAYYIGVSGTGLAEQREAIDRDYRVAAESGARLLDSTNEAESGAALSVRVSARTASLQQIALTGAGAVEELLRKMARWMGLSDEDVASISVVPNTDFGSVPFDGRSLVDLMTAKRMGLPISRDSVHGLLRSRGLTDLSLAEEDAALESEDEAAVSRLPVGTDAGDIEEGDDGDGE